MELQARLRRLEGKAKAVLTPAIIFCPSVQEYKQTHPEPPKGWGSVVFFVFEPEVL